MAKIEEFKETIQAGYKFNGMSITLGAAVIEGECISDAKVSIPLKTMNRHGLIAGATGTGKTKSLQMIAEQLSQNSVPVLLMDIKGDLSGIGAFGELNSKIADRHEKIGIPFSPDKSPVEFLSLSNEKGVRLRATVSEFGPVLFSKILGLNDTQAGVMAVVFKYCDDQAMPLLDLKDIKKVLQFLSNEGKEEIASTYGSIASATIGIILRKIVELESQGAELFFGERSFEVDDLCQIDENGRGVISILRLVDIQDRPKLFSTFMLQLLAEVYATFPEIGDPDQPRLVLFIDEAHLIFQEASSALLQQMETIIKLIRSKGVGVYFITQNPADIPESILGQLGMKIQHSLRAFTAKDRKAINLAADNFPISPYYDVPQLLIELGIGEALVTVLSEKGVPTPLVHCVMRAPQSRMDVLTDSEIDHLVQISKLVKKYNAVEDRESAYEILTAKLEAIKENSVAPEESQPKSTRQEKSTFEKVVESSAFKQLGRSLASGLARGILGVLGMGGKRR